MYNDNQHGRSPLKRGSIGLHPYVIDVLACLRRIHDETVWFNVEQVGRYLYRIDSEEGTLLLVDARHRCVEDSIESVLPLDCPGRIEPEHLYTVSWTEGGEQISMGLEASSPNLARLICRAPPHAIVEET